MRKEHSALLLNAQGRAQCQFVQGRKDLFGKGKKTTNFFNTKQTK